MDSVLEKNNDPNWEEEIALYDEYEGSGASFCRSRGLSVVRFQYWKEKLGKPKQNRVKSFAPFALARLSPKPETTVALPDARWVADIILHLHGSIR